MFALGTLTAQFRHDIIQFSANDDDYYRVDVDRMLRKKLIHAGVWFDSWTDVSTWNHGRTSCAEEGD